MHFRLFLPICLLFLAACLDQKGSLDSFDRSAEAPPPVKIAIDTFVQEDGLAGATAGVGYIVPRAIRFVGRHDRTYIAYGDEVCNPMITFFDHDLREWARPVQVGETGVPGDSHGLPSLAIDEEGRLHVLYGSHGGAHFMRVAMQPESINEWGPVLSPSQHATYGHTFFLEDRLFWFHREHFKEDYWESRGVPGLGNLDRPTRRDWGISYTDDSGGTWSDFQLACPSFDNGLFYPILGVGKESPIPSLHLAWLYRYLDGRRWEDMYYAVSFDLGTTWKTPRGDTIGPYNMHGQGERVFQGDTHGWNKQIVIDPVSGEPSILFATGGEELIDENNVMFASLRDGRWRVVKVSEATSRYVGAVTVVKGADHYRLYVATGEWNGGEVREWETTDGGATWTHTRDITQNSPAPNNRLQPIENAHPELQILWSSGDRSVPGSVYVWGEQGPVPTPDFKREIAQ